jgi:acetoin utilization deacetylase AcuC-like enzyme
VKFFYCDSHTFFLPEGHRFPIRKYTLLRERIEQSGIVPPENIIESEAATDEEILRVHTPEYLQKLKDCTLTEKEQRRLGFPWSPALLERSRRSVGGTIAACRAALVEGMAMNLAGGTHHAYPDHGEGFCVFCDVGIAARAMQAEGRAGRIAILDCDVHQGNGTAAVFADDPTVFTFSIHGANNFPLHKEKSDLDLELPDGTGDDEYLEAVDYGAQRALQLSNPSLAIYLAGADPFEGDTLGRLRVSKAGLARRDRLVFDHCAHAGVAVAIVLSGGYSKNVHDMVDIHFQTARLAVERSIQTTRSSPPHPPRTSHPTPG